MNRGPDINLIDELLAHSLAIEREAAERYAELADQMEVHHNHEVAALFRKLAAIEAKHIAEVERRSAGHTLPHIPPWEYRWGDAESPEAPLHDEAHYLMTPYHALSLALAAEQRAEKFFAQVAATATQEDVRRMAGGLRDEEAEHVSLIEKWLNRYPKPEAGWDQDTDPPTAHE